MLRWVPRSGTSSSSHEERQRLLRRGGTRHLAQRRPQGLNESSTWLHIQTSGDDLPTTAHLAPSPRVSVAAIADVPIEGARQDGEHRHLGDEVVDIDARVFEVKPGEPKPSRGMRGDLGEDAPTSLADG